MAEFQSTLLQKPFVENHVDFDHKDTVQDAIGPELVSVKSCIDPCNEDLLQPCTGSEAFSDKNHVVSSDINSALNNTTPIASVVKNYANSNYNDVKQNDVRLESFSVKHGVDFNHKDTVQDNTGLEFVLVKKCKDSVQNNDNQGASLVKDDVDSDRKDTILNNIGLEFVSTEKRVNSNNEDPEQNKICTESILVKNWVDSVNKGKLLGGTGPKSFSVDKHVDSNNKDSVQNAVDSRSSFVEKDIDSNHKDTGRVETSPESVSIENRVDIEHKSIMQNDNDTRSTPVENHTDIIHEDSIHDDTAPKSNPVVNCINSGYKDSVQNVTDLESVASKNHVDFNCRKSIQKEINSESASTENCVDSNPKDLIQTNTGLESSAIKNHIDSKQNNDSASASIKDYVGSNRENLVQNDTSSESSSLENGTDSNDKVSIHNDITLKNQVESSHKDMLNKTPNLKMLNNVSKKNCPKNDSKKFICREYKCMSSFDTLEEENSHVEKFHPDSKKYTFEYLHLDTSDKSKQRCAFCNKNMSISTLQDHYKKCKRKRFCNLLKCPVKDCISKFGSFKSQQSHINNRHHEPISCSYMYCDKFLKPSLLLAHLMNDHGHKNMNSFDADPYNAEKRSRNSLITKNIQTPHELQETHKEKYMSGPKRVPTIVCGIEGCAELFFKPSARVNHLIKRHITPFPCSYEGCSLQLRPHLLERHKVYVHGEFNPFQSKKMSLQSSNHAKKCHEKAMKDEKIIKHFKCPDKTCPATFLDDTTRCKHVNKCHRKIACPFEECDFASPSKELENHMKTQHAESLSLNNSEIDKFSLAKRKRFSCLVSGCESIFSCGSSRTNHLEKQHSSTVKCPFPDCNVQVSSEILSAHMKVKHGDIKDEILEAQLLQAEEAKSSTRKSLNDVKDPLVKTESICQDVKKENIAINLPEKIEKKGLSSIDHPVTVDNVVNNVSIKTEKKISLSDKSLSIDIDKMTKSRLEKIFDIKELFESMQDDKNNTVVAEKEFKCYVRGCPFVYNTVRSRKDHVYKSHAIPYPCPYNRCKVNLTPARLQNHLKYLHNPLRLVLESKATCTKVRLEYESRAKEAVKECDAVFECLIEQCTSKFSSVNSRVTHYNKYHPTPVPCYFPGCDISLKPSSLEIHIKRDHQQPQPKNERDSGRTIPNFAQRSVKSKKEPEETLPTKRAKIDEYEDQYVDIDKKYKCSFRDCPATFDTVKLRLDHEKLHSTLILCPHPECKLVKRGSLELNDHIRYDHVDFKSSCFKCKKSYKWIKIREHVENCQTT